MLGILRQQTPFEIVVYLLENPNSKHKEIMKHFDVPPSTLTYHLNKLVKNEIIGVKKSGLDRGYFILDKREVVQFIMQYKPSKVLKRWKDAWTEFSI